MAGLSLVNVKKIYPASNDQKKAKKAKKQEVASDEKKAQLQVTSEGVVAVQDFNLEVSDKEFIVLVGPSGCGKSTTLRMIAGLEEISAGELYIDGKLMNDVAPKDRDIAMVFQNYALYPHMTVRENMAFPLKLRKVPKDEINQKVEQAAQILDITQYLDRKPKALSGGQRQRVAIGRAIVREPKVLLMDEPLSNLDAKLRNQMRAEIIKLRHRIDTTFIYVTHDQTEAMTLGDRIVIMKDGFIQQIGTPQEVFDHPANLFVAGFIGTPQMNFFDAELVKQDGRYAVVLDGMTGHERSVDTLSGGEQFLASLSLALGLSETVQNQSGCVELEALFIDEGFGSLDQETLDTAMKALAMLHQGGRTIGIISHVSELRSRIGNRIEVSRLPDGSADAKVVAAE